MYKAQYFIKITTGFILITVAYNTEQNISTLHHYQILMHILTDWVT